ncbi:MAG: ATP-binding protein, partial [candidate division Zixibacteria bacterium]|nr:ATP-binding protein [candidate division Zixibacteria bacterium]
LQILRQKNTLNKETQKLLDSTEEEIFRLTELVKELVNFSNPNKYQPERKALLPILEKAISLVESDSISGKIVIKKDLASDLPPVFVNEKEILESFLNLIFNAIESMPLGGELKVQAKQTYLDEQKKAFIQVTISDQGMGIASDNLPRIFERYFTTKDGGTGLGLAVVDRIIKAHNGLIRVESQPRVGTTFEVFLPI